MSANFNVASLHVWLRCTLVSAEERSKRTKATLTFTCNHNGVIMVYVGNKIC